MSASLFLAKLPAIDIAVLVVYLVCMVGLGCSFTRRSGNPNQFMAAGRALPGWALGLSIFGSYISSITFLANPGKAYANNWNSFVFSLATPVAAIVAILWFVPFYRRAGSISAYEHLENRFGPWARTYAVVCFLLVQMARMGAIVYLLALAVAPLVGWPVRVIIILTGALMTTYTALGGIRAVVWTGVLQSIVLIAGPLICLAAVLLKAPGGLSGIVRTGWEQGKFSLGSFGHSISQSTFWVILVYGLVINLTNFGIDQSYVQRYITARSGREANKSVWLAALLYVPTAAVFFFIGTALFALYTPGRLPIDVTGDKVFPYFIAHELPTGLSGLVVAAIFAASMDPNLNSMATLTLCDIYQRYIRPGSGERESMLVLYISTLGWGIAGTLVGLTMSMAKRNVLDVWWELAGLFSSGMLGLFLLGRISRRATSRIAAIATAAGVAVALWVALSDKPFWPEFAGMARSPFHNFLAVVLGTIALLLVGLVLSAWQARGQVHAAGKTADAASLMDRE